MYGTTKPVYAVYRTTEIKYVHTGDFTLRKSPSGQYSIASRENGLPAICTTSGGTSNALIMFAWLNVSIISHSFFHCDALLLNFSLSSMDFMLFTAKHSPEFYIQTTFMAMIEQSLMSHLTHYRSYRGRFLQVIWPKQQCQSTEGNQLVFQIRLESH